MKRTPVYARRRTVLKRVPGAMTHEDIFALQIKNHLTWLPPPTRQYRFATELGREFRADFAWPAYKLLLEVQGGIWRQGGGAHSHPTRLLDDIDKAQHAAMLCWIVLPVTTDEVTNGKAVELLATVLNFIKASQPQMLRLA